MRQQHLAGLRLEPYASYLGAIGLLSILTRQADPTCRLWTSGGHFHLETRLAQDELLDFLLHRYQPAPIVSPWNQESGFYAEAGTGPLAPIQRAQEPRWAPYQATISAAQRILSDAGLTEAPTGEPKDRLIGSCFAGLPAPAHPWLNAVFKLTPASPAYSPLLFTGGNDGRFDLSRQYLLALDNLFSNELSRSYALLRAALLDEPTSDLQRATQGFLNPSSTESMSAQSGGKPITQANPWNLVLALEGLTVMAPRLRLRPTVPAGQASLGAQEKTRGELWLPLWDQPLTLEELRARDNWPAHHRFGVIARNGKAHFALPLGTAPREGFWREPVAWLEQSRKTVPPRLWQALEDYASRPHPSHLIRALEVLGEEDLAALELDKRWVRAADDGSPEFSLALSLAGLGQGLDKKLLLRGHLSHFRGADLPSRMLSLLRRRSHLARTVSMRPNRAGILRYNSPFWSRYPASPPVISAFLRGALDERKVHRLLRGLLLVQAGEPKSMSDDVWRLPWLYRVCKLACHSDGVDRRPSPPDLPLLLAQGRFEQAAGTAVNFLAGRHQGFPTELPSISYGGDARRLAAALLIPISNSTYSAIVQTGVAP